METNFSMWTQAQDPILSDLAKRYLYRKPLASVRIDEETKNLLPKLKSLIKQAGFNPDYYTATNSAFDEPYDAYKPTGKNANSQIEIMQDDGSMIELSQLSPLVRALMVLSKEMNASSSLKLCSVTMKISRKFSIHFMSNFKNILRMVP